MIERCKGVNIWRGIPRNVVKLGNILLYVYCYDSRLDHKATVKPYKANLINKKLVLARSPQPVFFFQTLTNMLGSLSDCH